MPAEGSAANEDTRLGALLVRAGELSTGDLERAIAQQVPGRRFGETLIQLGLVTREAVEAALKEQLRDARLGQILLRIGAVDEAALRGALARQTESGRMIGELLVEAGACSTEEVDWALAQQSAEKRTGAVFLRRGLIDHEALEACFAILHREPDRLLTEIMVERGHVTPEQVRETLRVQLVESRLGQVLLEMGVLSAEQLQFALAEQTVSGAVLGQVLIQLGFCDVTQLSAALARQLIEA
jgi:hypothetical protein